MADVRAVDAADWAGVVQDALAQVAADDILRALTSDPLTAPFAVDRIVECVQSAITDEQGRRLSDAVQAKERAEAALLEYQDEVRARLDDADRQRSASGDAQQQIRSLRADLQEQTRLADDAAANARHQADAVQCAERAANALRLQCDAHKAAERVAHERAGQIESRLDELVAVNDELESRLRAAEKDAAALRDQLADHRTVVAELASEKAARQEAVSKGNAVRAKAEKIALALRKSEQQRMKLAHKYSLVGSKVESLVRAEEDLNADNIAKLTAQLNAATTQLQDRKRLFSREKDALKERIQELEKQLSETTAALRASNERAASAESALESASADKKVMTARVADLTARVEEGKQLLDKAERSAAEAKRVREGEWEQRLTVVNMQLVEKTAEYERTLELEVRSRTEEEARRIHRHYQTVLRQKLQQQVAKVTAEAQAAARDKVKAELAEAATKLAPPPPPPPPPGRPEETALLAELVRENESFRSALRKEAEQRIEREKDRLEADWSARLSSLDADRERAVADAQSARAEVASARLAVVNAERSATEAGFQVQQLTQQLESEARRRHTLTQHLNEASTNIAKLSALLDEETKGRQSLEGGSMAASARIAELEDWCRSADAAYHRLQEQFETTQAQLVKRTADLEEARRALDTAERRATVAISDAASTADRFESTHRDSLSAARHEHLAETLKLTSQISVLEERVRLLERDLASARDELRAAQSQHEQQLASAEQHKNRLRESISEMQVQVDDRVRALQEVIKDKSNELSEAQAELGRASSVNADLQDRVTTLQGDLEALRRDHERQRVSYERHVDALRAGHSQLVVRGKASVAVACSGIRSTLADISNTIRSEIDSTRIIAERGLTAVLWRARQSEASAADGQWKLRGELQAEFTQERHREVQRALDAQAAEFAKTAEAARQASSSTLDALQARFDDARAEIGRLREAGALIEAKHQEAVDALRKAQVACEEAGRERDQVAALLQTKESLLASTERARDDLSERERALVAQVQELVAQIRHYEAAAAVVGKFVGVDRESLETLFVGGDSPAESFQRLERLRLLLEHFRDDVAASATSAPLDRIRSLEGDLQHVEETRQRLEADLVGARADIDRLQIRLTGSDEINESSALRIAKLEQELDAVSKKAQSAAEENASLKGNLQNQAASKAHASHRRSNSRAEQQMAKLLAGDIDELALAPRKMSLSRESVSFVRLPDASPFLDDMNLFGNDLDDADTSRRQHPRRRPSLQLVRSPSTTIEHAKSAATSADEEASIVETVDDDDDYADDVESVIVQAPPSAPVRSRADERPSVEKRAPPGAVVAAAVDVVAAAPVPDDDVRHAGSIQQAAAVEPVDDVSAAGSGGPYRVSAEKQEASKLQEALDKDDDDVELAGEIAAELARAHDLDDKTNAVLARSLANRQGALQDFGDIR
ncbi:Uncharacterized protein PBTT_09673 [Plasmodiophora brassicae]